MTELMENGRDDSSPHENGMKVTRSFQTLSPMLLPASGNVNVADADDLASTLSSARVLRMYFPASLNAKPFCFAEVSTADKNCSLRYLASLTSDILYVVLAYMVINISIAHDLVVRKSSTSISQSIMATVLPR